MAKVERDAAIREYLGLAQGIARKLTSRLRGGADYQDAEQQAFFPLMHAIDTWDGRITLKAYVSIHVRWGIQNWLRKINGGRQAGLVRHILSIDNWNNVDGTPRVGEISGERSTPEQAARYEQLWAAVDSELTRIQARVIRMQFQQEITQCEIANQLHLSAARVSQHLNDGLRKLSTSQLLDRPDNPSIDSILEAVVSQPVAKGSWEWKLPG